MFNETLARIKERVTYQGDMSIVAKYLPFARNKANQLKSIFKNINSTGMKTFSFPDADISVKIANGERRINIIAKSLVAYISGIIRGSTILPDTDTLHEHYPKVGTGGNPRAWTDVKKFGITPHPDVIALGYPQIGQSQHANLKATNFSGLMRPAVQLLLGTNKQVGFNYSFNESDCLIYEHIDFDGEFVDGILQSWIGRYDLRYVKINPNGIYLKKANNTIPKEAIRNIPASYSIMMQPNEFHTILNDSSFELPSTFTDDVNKSGVYHIPLPMGDFYGKDSFYDSCGWAVMSGPSYIQSSTTSMGLKHTHCFGFFNTCHSGGKSYIYGIRLIQEKTEFSPEFKLTPAYYDNPIYDGLDFYYEYSASLHKLMEGYLSKATAYYPWMTSNSGFYVPDNIDGKVKPFPMTSTTLNVINESATTLNDKGYAPLHVMPWGEDLRIVNLSPFYTTTTYPLTSIDKDFINTYLSKYVVGVNEGTYRITLNPTDFYIQEEDLDLGPSNSLGTIDKTQDHNMTYGASIYNFNVLLVRGGNYIIVPQYDRERTFEVSATVGSSYDEIPYGTPSSSGTYNGEYSITYQLLDGVIMPEYTYISDNVYYTDVWESIPATPIHDMDYPVPRSVFPSYVELVIDSVHFNEEFKFDFTCDVFSKKSGLHYKDNEYIQMDGGYPNTDLTYLSFIGKP